MKNPTEKNRNGSGSKPAGEALRKQIEKRAHELWQAGGCREGNAEADWLQAEREVLSQGTRDQERTRQPAQPTARPQQMQRSRGAEPRPTTPNRSKDLAVAR